MKQNMNILVPMAGRGSRFKDVGYTDSKPFIDVNGKPMIHRVIENLNIDFSDTFYRFIIVCLIEDFEKYYLQNHFEDYFGHDRFNLVVLDKMTEGAAQTVLQAKDLIDSDISLLTLNSDQMIKDGSIELFDEYKNFDGGILCFCGEGTDWSYAKTDDNGLVTEVAEKRQISNEATAGYYYWKKGSDFVKYAEQMIEHNDRSKGEFYVAPVYNWAIKDGKKIAISIVEKVYQLGTPSCLKSYLNGEQ